MLVEYNGPPDTYNVDVAAALAAARGDVEATLPDQRPEAPEGAEVTVTNPAAPAPALPRERQDLRPARRPRAAARRDERVVEGRRGRLLEDVEDEAAGGGEGARRRGVHEDVAGGARRCAARVERPDE
jgi:hypothetical protein